MHLNSLLKLKTNKKILILLSGKILFLFLWKKGNLIIEILILKQNLTTIYRFILMSMTFAKKYSLKSVANITLPLKWIALHCKEKNIYLGRTKNIIDDYRKKSFFSRS